MNGVRIGVDVGGTFTDGFAYEETTGVTRISKVPTTPGDPSIGVLQCIDELVGSERKLLTMLVHGTTININTLIQSKGSKVGLITIKGMKDIPDIQRTTCPYEDHRFNLYYRKPIALAPRNLRREVSERTAYDGTILTPLNQDETLRAAEQLVAAGADVITICFLNSYRNPFNERLAQDAIKKKFADVHVITSSEISPEILEYERFSATILNAYLMGSFEKYLTQLEFLGLGERFMIMADNGGLMTASTAKNRPVMALKSTLAAGVAGAQFTCSKIGVSKFITFDMGGTTTDVCLVDREPMVSNENLILGFAVNLPQIDVYAIGAGGGSLAWVDEAEALHVGPQSAGADPGPACYGKGNEPTTTDAQVLLGRLHPEYFLGGRMQIFPELSDKAVSKIAVRLGMTNHQAALGILEVVLDHMADAARLLSVKKGCDPREFSLFAFGGAGPLHAGEIAKRLGTPKVIIPPYPGAHSALGMIVTDVRHDFARSVVVHTRELDIQVMNEVFQDLENEAGSLLVREKVEETELRRLIDMRYVGQGYVPVSLPVRGGKLRKEDLTDIEKRFSEQHLNLYRHFAENEPTEIVNLRLVAIGKVSKPGSMLWPANLPTPAVKSRKVYFQEFEGFVDCPIYIRSELPASFSIEGPAVVHQLDSTIVVYPGQKGSVDMYGNLIIDAA